MKKNVELLEPRTGLMECKKCGARWLANIKPDTGGKYYRGCWTCYNCGA